MVYDIPFPLGNSYHLKEMPNSGVIMKALIIGDIHARFEKAEAHYNSIMQVHTGLTLDILIIPGDFGFWPRARKNKPWTRKFPHKTVWVDGNHEDHEILLRLDEPNWGLESKNMPNLEGWQECLEQWEYKSRGTIEDGILYIGGAKSVGPNTSMRGIDWFPEENISYMDQERVFNAIEEYGPENIHTVISHDCPGSFDVSVACTSTGIEIIDGNRKFLEAVKQYVRPSRWYFGHYHRSMSGNEDGTYWRCVNKINGNGKDDFVIVDLPD